MTPEEYRLILDAHTLADSGDGGDRDLLEAKERLKHDAGLNDWFAKRRTGDERISKALCAVPVPGGLRERLLKLESTRGVASTPWMRRQVVKALAAAALIGIATFLWRMFFRSPTAGGTWQDQALAQVAQLDSGALHLDRETNDYDTIKNYLQQQGSPVPGDLPGHLTANPRVGCKVIEVKGHKATVVCFEIAPGLLAHLVVLNVGPEVSKVPVGHPAFDSEGKWQMASWSDGKKTYMLGTRADREKLASMFS